MTNINKVKDTINKLCIKYQKTSWKNILPSVFESDQFDTAVHQLVSDVQAGQPFTPQFKDMFKSFDICPLEEVKVVFVNAHPNPDKLENDGLAFSLGNNKFKNSLTQGEEAYGNLEHLPKQGVMLLNMALTCPVDKPKDHVPMWNSISSTIINYIAAETKQTIFVFVGENVEQLSKEVGVYHPKLFIPSFKDDDQNWESIDIFDRVNGILKKLEKTTIDW